MLVRLWKKVKGKCGKSQKKGKCEIIRPSEKSCIEDRIDAPKCLMCSILKQIIHA